MTPGRLLYLIRFNQQRGWRAAWYDYRVAPLIRHFRLPVDLAEAPSVPVHLLTSKDDWLRATWTLASWYQATGRNWQVVIHEDGTLPPEGRELMGALFPTARFILRSEADDKMARVLAPYPRCRDYRAQLALGLKIFDVPYFCQAQRFLILDSDVLFFRRPEEILAWVDTEDRRCLFNAEAEDPCPLSSGEARQKLRVQLLPRINSGLALLWRDALDLPFCEMALRDTSLGSAYPWRIEQSLFALCTSRENRAALLPPTYEMSLKSERQENAIARHYVGAVRQQFYAEGIRQLQASLLPGV